MSSHANRIQETFGQNPEVPENLISYYIFVFDRHKITSEQEQKILSTQSEKRRQLKPLAFSLEDFLKIEKVIRRHFRQRRQKRRIIIVTDEIHCEEIIQEKINKKCLRGIDEIFLCYKEQTFEARKIMESYEHLGLINKHTHDLDELIKRAEDNFKNLRVSYDILRNFRPLFGQDYKKQSSIMKFRANGCIHLAPQYYEEYKKLFSQYLIKWLSLKPGSTNNGFTQIMSEIQSALDQLQDKKFKQFQATMLKLYQGHYFYQIINKGLLNFTKQQFPWRSLALPFSLLFKAIKMEFKASEKEIEKLFGQNDEITVSRAGKISTQQLESLQLNKQKHPFYELSSFTSTSIDKMVPIDKFLDSKDYKKNCLMQFKLKKPKFNEEIKNFTFIYQSFAMVPDQNGIVKQSEILLNSLTIIRLLSITRMKYRDIKSMESSTKFEKIPDNQQIPVITFEVGTFQSMLEDYKMNKNQLSPEDRDLIEHYLLTVDFLKNYEEFDIGDSLRLSGDLQASYEYDIHKIRQLEMEQTTANTEEKKFKNKMKYHQTCDRFADTCFDLGMENESIAFSEVSIQTYKMIEELDTKRSYKQRQQYINKKLQKHANILQYFDRIEEACQAIKNRIKEFEKQMLWKTDAELACQFFIAKLLINLGMIQFKQGNAKKAKKYFDESDSKMKKIMKQIQYDSLKTETFYLRFIFHYLFARKEQTMDKQSYFKVKRAYNIAQATHIFGGAEQFEEVVSSSRDLKEKVDNYIQSQREIQNKNQSEGKQKINMLHQIEQKFIGDPLTLKLEPQLKSFFNSFQSSIKNAEESSFEKKSKEIYNLILEAVSQNLQKVGDYDDRIISLKNELIVEKLDDWSKIDYAQKNTALQIRSQIDRQIITLKKQQIANSLKSKVRSANYQQYLKKTIGMIHQYLQSQKDFGYNNPTLEKIKEKLALEEFLERQSQQFMEERQLDEIIHDAKTNKNFILKLIEAYILNVKLHYSIADLDFLNCLENIPEQKRESVKRLQLDMIKKCEQQIEAAKSSINNYKKQNSIKQTESKLVSFELKSNKQCILQKTRKEIQLKHSSMQYQHQKRILNQLQDKIIHLTLLQQKCNIFMLAFARQAEKNKGIVEIKNILSKVNTRISSSKQQNKLRVLYNEVNGHLLYMCKEYSQSFNSLRVVLQSINEISEVRYYSELLTKIHFMFYNERLSLESLSHKLTESELEHMNYPFYWRVCLANHFQYKKIGKNSCYYIERCVQFMRERKKEKQFKTQYFTLKFQLVNDCEYAYCLKLKNRAVSQLSRARSFMNTSSRIYRTNSYNFEFNSRSALYQSSMQNKPNVKEEQEKISIQLQQCKTFEQIYKPKEFDLEEQKRKRQAQKQQKPIQFEMLKQKSIKAEQEQEQDAISEKYSPWKGSTSLQKNSFPNAKSNQASFNNQSQQFEQLPKFGSRQNKQEGLKAYFSHQLIISQQSQSINQLESGLSTEAIHITFNKVISQSQQLQLYSNNENKKELFKQLNQFSSIGKLKMSPKQSFESNDDTPSRQKNRKNRYLYSKTSSPNSGLLKFSKREQEKSLELMNRVLSSCSQQNKSMKEIKEQIKLKSSQPYNMRETNSSSFLENCLKKYELNKSSPRKKFLQICSKDLKNTKISRSYLAGLKKKQSNTFTNPQPFQSDFQI